MGLGGPIEWSVAARKFLFHLIECFKKWYHILKYLIKPHPLWGGVGKARVLTFHPPCPAAPFNQLQDGRIAWYRQPAVFYSRILSRSLPELCSISKTQVLGTSGSGMVNLEIKKSDEWCLFRKIWRQRKLAWFSGCNGVLKKKRITNKKTMVRSTIIGRYGGKVAGAQVLSALQATTSKLNVLPCDHLTLTRTRWWSSYLNWSRGEVNISPF